MIHKMKALYDEGNGSSMRAIAEELHVSRNTVKKYLEMDEEEIAVFQEKKRRAKRLDVHRAFIVHLLKSYPRLSAVKILRKLEKAHGDLSVSSRTARRYIAMLKDEVTVKQRRYYEPVLEMEPGVQCQVDGGELRGVSVGGVETTVHFVVFVLSYSRLMYVGLSPEPVDTERLIGMHDAAFRAFGGRPEECVYDQTKLVVIAEAFRELDLNQRFHQYATGAGFRIRVCEGYDPESKGKVEAGVKYVKQNGLYGETFEDWPALEEYVARWLEDVANVRSHGTTGESPRTRYERDERARMLPYLCPADIKTSAPAVDTRKADKTGLVAWKSNKYSVPMAYQRSRVGVVESAGRLHVIDRESGEIVAKHVLATGKGEIVKNTDHYRDRTQQIADYEQAVREQLGEEAGARICALLKQTSPRIYKDQLAGVQRIMKKHGIPPLALLERLCQRTELTATAMRDLIIAYRAHPECLDNPSPPPRQTTDKQSATTASLAAYGTLTADNATETCVVGHPMAPPTSVESL